MEKQKEYKFINLTQNNLNKLEIGEKFLYMNNKHYKKGIIACKMNYKNIMIPLSTICDIKSGIKTAQRLFNY